MNTFREKCNGSSQHNLGFIQRYIGLYNYRCKTCGSGLSIRPTLISSAIEVMMMIGLSCYLFLCFSLAVDFSVLLLISVWCLLSFVARSNMIFVATDHTKKLSWFVDVVNLAYLVFILVAIMLLSTIFGLSDFSAMNTILLPIIICPPLFNLKRDSCIEH